MPRRDRCSWLLGIALAACATTAAGQAEYESIREPAMNRLGAHLQAGRLADARRDLADHVARHPGDALMVYNLACLAARAGDLDDALAFLQAALDGGYRDHHRIRTTPDLAALADDPRLHALLAAASAERLERMHAAAFDLEEGVWSEPTPLSSPDHDPGLVRFRYDHAGLTAAITLPPAGADVVIAVVSLPHSLEHFETSRWLERSVRFDGSELDRLRQDGDTWLLDLPWSSLKPYQPPLELLLGLNVVLRRETGPQQPAERWSLVDDPHAGSRLTPWRRFAPATLVPGSPPAPLLAGRLDSYLVVGDQLSVELGLQGGAAGPARISLFTGATTIAAEPDTTLLLDLEDDLAYATLDFRLAHLPSPGWFAVGASVADAAGSSFTWRDRGFRLAPDWFVRQQERLAEVPEAEHPIVQFHLVGTLRGYQAFRPHDDPAALARSALTTMDLLDRAAATGTVVPAGAVRLEGGMPAGGDALLACQLVLPAAAARRGGDLTLVLVSESEFAESLARALEQRRTPDDARTFVVVAVRLVPGQPESAAPAITAGRAWLEALARPIRWTLAGVGPAASAAVRAAADAQDGHWHGLLLLEEAAEAGAADAAARLLDR